MTISTLILAKNLFHSDSDDDQDTYDDIDALPSPPSTPPAQTQGVAKGCKVFLQFSSRIKMFL